MPARSAACNRNPHRHSFSTERLPFDRKYAITPPYSMDLSGFDQTEKIGESSRAEIWKARQISLDRLVCLRMLKSQYASNPDEVKSFVEPARAAAKLKHAGLVQIYDVVANDSRCYIVMEYAPGILLSNALVNGSIPQRRAMQVARTIAAALDYAWRTSRLVHRNIKPSVIALDDAHTAKISDISLATIVDPQGHPMGKDDDTIKGTPNYIAPELVHGSGVIDFRADMYSLGATLYHMVTGVIPFAGIDQVAVLDKQVNDTIPNPRDVVPTILSGTAKIIQRMMMKNPLDRYHTWAEAMRDMDKIASGGFLVVKPLDGAPRPSTVADPFTPTDEKAERAAALQARAVPLVIRMLLWLVLLFALTVLFFHRLGLPVDQALGHYAALVVPTRPTPESAVAPRAGAAVPNVTVQQTPPAPNNAAALTPDEQALLRKTKENLAELLVERQTAKAAESLDWELRQAAVPLLRQELDALRSIVTAVAQLDRAVVQEFEAKVGKDVAVRLKNGVANIRLQAISGDTVCGAPVSEDGAVATNSVVFRISSVDPIERSRWLGAATTPDRSAMKFLLYMEGGDYESAAAFALNCGPLAEAFRAIVKRKQTVP
jgi:hypothetical protein